MTRIENWKLGTFSEEDMDHGKMRLSGKVYNHYRKKDGSSVITSSVVSIDMENWLATTSSGNVYELGKPSAEYIKWLEDNGWPSAKELKRKLLEMN